VSIYPMSGANVARCDLEVFPGLPVRERVFQWEDADPPEETELRIGESSWEGATVGQEVTFDLPDLTAMIGQSWVLVDTGADVPLIAGGVVRWADGAVPSTAGVVKVVVGSDGATLVRPVPGPRGPAGEDAPSTADEWTVTPAGEMVADNVQDALEDLYDRTSVIDTLDRLDSVVTVIEEFVGGTGLYPTAVDLGGGGTQSQGFGASLGHLLEMNVTNVSDRVMRYLPLVGVEGIPTGEMRARLALPLGGTSNAYFVRVGFMSTADTNHYGAYIEFEMTGTNTWTVSAKFKNSGGTTSEALGTTTEPNHKVRLNQSGGLLTWWLNDEEVHQASAGSLTGVYTVPGVRVNKTVGSTLRTVLLDYLTAQVRVDR
jgi:hypothetical protein